MKLQPQQPQYFLQASTAINTSDCISRGRKFDPGSFTEIDYENNFYGLLLPSVDSRRDVVSYKRKYVLKVLGNRLVKLVQEKSVVG